MDVSGALMVTFDVQGHSDGRQLMYGGTDRGSCCRGPSDELSWLEWAPKQFSVALPFTKPLADPLQVRPPRKGRAERFCKTSRQVVRELKNTKRPKKSDKAGLDPGGVNKARYFMF